MSQCQFCQLYEHEDHHLTVHMQPVGLRTSTKLTGVQHGYSHACMHACVMRQCYVVTLCVDACALYLDSGDHAAEIPEQHSDFVLCSRYDGM